MDGVLTTEAQGHGAWLVAECFRCDFLHPSPREGIFLHTSASTCHDLKLGRGFPCANFNSGKHYVQPLHCLRCRREIESGDKSVAVYMFAQTVGVKPRQKSTAQRICFCPQCAVSLAMGMPPEGALNMAAWEMIRDLVSAEPSLNQAAWESLRGVALLTSGSDESQVANWRVTSRRAV